MASPIRLFPRPRDQQLVSDAILQVKIGDRESARALLDQACQINRDNEQAWVWRASLATSRAEAIPYLTEVHRLNPQNKYLRSWLEVNGQNQADRWKCPLCSAPARTRVSRCTSCRAILDLDDLALFAKGNGVGRDQMRSAIKRLDALVLKGPDFDTHVNLALAWLNMLGSENALGHLREASKINPNDAQVQRAIDGLQRRKLILVVDDSATIRQMLEGVLESDQYRVRTACDGFKALAQISEQRPDAILLDVKMPGMDGYQVCKIIRANKQTTDVPIVMISGSFMDKVRGRMVGCNLYIEKPFTKLQILQAIAGVVWRDGWEYPTDSQQAIQ